MSGPVTPARHRKRNCRQPCCRNIFSQLLMEMRILNIPVLYNTDTILVSVLAKEYCDDHGNITCFKMALALCACYTFTQVTITELFVSFIRIFLMTYFNKIKKHCVYKRLFFHHFCQHTLYCNVLLNPLSNLQQHSTLRGQIK